MLGIMIPEFPLQTHIFFSREIVALRAMGVPVAILSTRRPPEGACRHDFAPEAREETHYVYPPSASSTLGALFTNPKVRRALGYLMKLKETPFREKYRGLGLFLCAADLKAYSKRKGIEHIHVHSCADAAHVAAMCNILGGPSYSLTLHGDLPVYGVDHAAKMARAACITCDGPHLKEQIVEKVGYPAESHFAELDGVGYGAFLAGLWRERRGWETQVGDGGAIGCVQGASICDRCGEKGGRCGNGYTVHAGGGGAGETEYRGACRAIKFNRSRDASGQRGESEVLELLRKSDAFVLSSVGMGEAGPISLMEAMSCGLPAVCSVIGATPQMLTDGVEGMLVPQEDEGKLADAFVRLALIRSCAKLWGRRLGGARWRNSIARRPRAGCWSSSSFTRG